MIKKEASQKLQEQTSALAENIITRLNRILGAITDATPTDVRDRALRIHINDCVELARLLAVQKARFKLIRPRILPHQQTVFNASEMDDIGGEDEDSLMGREVWCVTFPGIAKFGDEQGGNTQFRNVISKARVLCSPE
jgi:activating signal cointegrator complex subunit 1